jgi:hypothetical protein
VQYLYDHDLFPKEPRVIARILVRGAAVLVILAASGIPAAAQAVQLRYQWKQGDVLTYRTEVRTTSSATGGPLGPHNVGQTLAQTFQITVAAVNPTDGSATLRHVMQSVSVDMTTPAGKIVYDSTRPIPEDADPRVQGMAKTLGGMIGEAISVTIAPTGAVRRIDGTARVVQKLIENLPRDPRSGGLAQNIKTMLSDDALRSSLEQSFSRLPEQPVNIGDAWTAEQTVSAGPNGRVLGKSTFTLKSIDGTGDAAVAHIAVSFELRQVDAPAGVSTAVKLGAGSKGEGEVAFSIGPGRIETNGMRTDIPSTVTMRGPDGNTTTIESITRTTMTMVRVVK